jgi:hypothetical protein
MITCLIRYDLGAGKIGDFKQYARAWMTLIEKYGGTHHGYFVPAAAPPDAEFSFKGVGRDGPENVGVALFSFPSIEAYESYRREVKNDPNCIAATAQRDASECFTGYERTFLEPVER